MEFDAIVVGSGITGGWAAKELCERGFKTLVVERGRDVGHGGRDYTDHLAPWEVDYRGLPPEHYADEGWAMLKRKGDWIYRAEHLQFFADTETYPYSYPEARPFMWTRGIQLGGRSITWGRQCYRRGEDDFEANKRDGHGVDWPIRYRDLAPWYDHVERFIGVSGARDGLASVPDGVFQPPWEMSCAERFVAENLRRRALNRRMIIGRVANLTAPSEEQAALGRGRCQARDVCSRGCGFGAYFSSLSATLPAAQRTGNLTIVTDAICASLEYDAERERVSGVRVVDANTKAGRTYRARVVFLCASAVCSAHILLNSRSEAFPRGLANTSDALGRYLMDHVDGASASAIVPGFEDRYEFGRRPTGIYVPNFRRDEPAEGFLRGYGYQGGAHRSRLRAGAGARAGIGAPAKEAALEFGPWRISLGMFGEMLPYAHNRVSLHPTKKDRWGIPLAHIDARLGDNERAMVAQAARDAADILIAGGCIEVTSHAAPIETVGARTHEMGTARMGRDPATSVLNGWGQAHDVPNLFVTDGAAMASSATQNPSLTYMAITARAAAHAAALLRDSAL